MCTIKKRLKSFTILAESFEVDLSFTALINPMIFPDSCPSNQVELKRRECDFVGLLRCVCHQGLRDGVHSISEAEAGTRYEPQLGSVNATPFHTTLIGVIPRGRMD